MGTKNINGTLNVTDAITVNGQVIVNALEFLAPAYDSTNTYNTSDLVVYGGALYVCKADNTTGTWDDTKWDTTTIAESVLGLLNEAI